MSAPQSCLRADSHAPHFHYKEGRVGTGIVSCPGVDPAQGLAPERDRPTGPEFDWTPESLHLTMAAAMVVRTHQQTERDTAPTEVVRGMYRGALAVWSELCGMDQPEALTYAYSIATLVPPVTAAPIPF